MYTDNSQRAAWGDGNSECVYVVSDYWHPLFDVRLFYGQAGMEGCAIWTKVGGVEWVFVRSAYVRCQFEFSESLRCTIVDGARCGTVRDLI